MNRRRVDHKSIEGDIKNRSRSVRFLFGSARIHERSQIEPVFMACHIRDLYRGDPFISSHTTFYCSFPLQFSPFLLEYPSALVQDP